MLEACTAANEVNCGLIWTATAYASACMCLDEERDLTEHYCVLCLPISPCQAMQWLGQFLLCPTCFDAHDVGDSNVDNFCAPSLRRDLPSLIWQAIRHDKLRGYAPATCLGKELALQLVGGIFEDSSTYDSPYMGVSYDARLARWNNRHEIIHFANTRFHHPLQMSIDAIHPFFVGADDRVMLHTSGNLALCPLIVIYAKWAHVVAWIPVMGVAARAAARIPPHSAPTTDYHPVVKDDYAVVEAASQDIHVLNYLFPFTVRARINNVRQITRKKFEQDLKPHFRVVSSVVVTTSALTSSIPQPPNSTRTVETSATAEYALGTTKRSHVSKQQSTSSSNRGNGIHTISSLALRTE